MMEENRINLDKPRWDQTTYSGRLRHFFTTTNPANILCSSAELDRVKDIVTRYKRGEKVYLSTDEIWRAKHIYDSAFHPDTGEKMLLIGRMSAQVPMCMVIGGSMLTFYKTTKEVILMQWINQSFNALVNYTNRSGSSPIPASQLGISYGCATTGAMAVALALNRLVKRAPLLVGRFVPYAAVAAANCINIPLIELTDGIPVVDEIGNEVGKSKNAAVSAVGAVTFSRIVMAAPGFVIPPILMNHLEKKGFLKRYTWSSGPIQILLFGVILTFAVPMCCAVFPQQAAIHVSKLEPELQVRLKQLPRPVNEVYYNKGL